MFFLSNSFIFQYEKSAEKDIQKKYKSYNYLQICKNLSDVYQSNFIFKNVDANNETDLCTILNIIKHNVKVMINLHIKALPYGQAEANRDRDDTYHWVRVEEMKQNNIILYDDYIPDLRKGYTAQKVCLDFFRIYSDIQHYLIIYKPRNKVKNATVRQKMLSSLTNFAKISPKSKTANGLEAIQYFIKDLPYVLTEQHTLRHRNLMGILFLLKYQIYPGYYYMIEAALNLITIEKQTAQIIKQLNFIWNSIFIKIDMLMIQTQERQLRRLEETVQELYQLLGTLIDIVCSKLETEIF